MKWVIQKINSLVTTYGIKYPYNKLSIYPMYNYDTFGFTVLSDEYSFPEELDSSVIEGKYLRENEIVNNNYHILSPEYRKRFLRKVNIFESESIFMYNLKLDSIIEYKVSETPVVAFINVYGAGSPIAEYDYMIGFETGLNLFGNSNYTLTLVATDSINPFVKGKVKPARWEKLQGDEFPNVDIPVTNEAPLIDDNDYKVYYNSYNGYNYYLKDFQHNARQLIIKEESTGAVVKNQIYYSSEGTELTPLNFVQSDNENYIAQWVGPLFKNKSDVIFGLLSFSFGCDSIDFVDDSEKPVRIKCDNRH